MSNPNSIENSLDQFEWDEYARSADAAKRKTADRVGDPAEIRVRSGLKIADQPQFDIPVEPRASLGHMTQFHAQPHEVIRNN